MACQKKTDKRQCSVCGQEFEPTNGNSRYCPACKKRNYMKAKSCPKAVLPKRACHDCGKPTTDYRCPTCRCAWAKKNAVELCVLGIQSRDTGAAAKA